MNKLQKILASKMKDLGGMDLAQEITEIFYGTDEARQAKKSFVSVFQKGNVPNDMPEFKVRGDQTLLDILQENGLVKSRGEGRRLVEQNGVKLDGETLTDPNMLLSEPGVLQIGKRRFLRIVT